MVAITRTHRNKSNVTGHTIMICLYFILILVSLRSLQMKYILNVSKPISTIRMGISVAKIVGI